MSLEFALNQTPPASAAVDCVIVGAYGGKDDAPDQNMV